MGASGNEAGEAERQPQEHHRELVGVVLFVFSARGRKSWGGFGWGKDKI